MASSVSTNIENRIIRVFISSTFKDLDVERNYLAKKVFPLIRNQLEKYNITLVDIDLRWGITEEDAKNNKIAKICLEQIENTKPFFIGILGDRYGWAPDSQMFHEVGIEKLSYEGLSITEIEIQYGVLRNKEQMHAAFFLRTTSSTADTYNETSASKQKLHRLKEQIKRSSYPHFEFTDAEQLGRQVTDAIMQWVEQTYDLQSFSKLAQIEAEQKYIKANRKIGYIPHKHFASDINRFMESDFRFWIIRGVDGSGKRAFMVNAAEYIREHQQADSVIEYYFEDGGDKEDIGDAEIFITEQIKNHIGWVIPEAEWINDYTLPLSFNQLMKSIYLSDPMKKWVLVLGGIHLFDLKDLKNWLCWIAKLPPHIKVIFAIGEHYMQKNAIQDILYKEANNILEIGYFLWDRPDRVKIITEYFSFYGKNVQPEICDTILHSPCQILGYNVFHNHFALRLLLNEMRVYGNFDTLGQYVAELSTHSDDAMHFYRALLSNWQKEYDISDNNMVIKILCILLNSKNGVSERDILDFTKAPVIKWQQFFTVLDPFVDYRNGLLCMHKSRQTTFRRLLDTELKDVIYQWILYLEECILDKDREIDYIYSELSYQYKDWAMTFEKSHQDFLNSVSADIQALQSSDNFSREEMIQKLYTLIRPLKVAEWFCNTNRLVELKKHWGYLKRYDHNPDIYLKDILGGISEGTIDRELFAAGCVYTSLQENSLSYETYKNLIQKTSSRKSLSLPYFNIAIELYCQKKEVEALAMLEKGRLLALHEMEKEMLTKDDYAKFLLFGLKMKNAESITEEEMAEVYSYFAPVSAENIVNFVDWYDLLIAKCKSDDVNKILEYSQKKINLFKHIKYNETLRSHCAYAYSDRGDLYYNMQMDMEAIEDYKKAFDILDPLELADSDCYRCAIIGQRIAILGSLSDNRDINYVYLLERSALLFSFLLYYREGWKICEEEMAKTIELMELIMELYPNDIVFKSYSQYKEEFGSYKKTALA